MSWCDKLAATPGVGFGLEAHYTSVAAIQDALTPVLDKLARRDIAAFTVDQQLGPFAFGFTTNDGFQYGIEPSKVYIGFSHRMKMKLTSAGPPTVEMTSVAKPFTELLPEVSRRLIDATLALPNAEKREVFRVGVMSTAQVDLDEAPPGIRRFVDYIGRPWHALPDSFVIHLTTKIKEGDEYSDRCIHTLQKNEKENENLLQMSLDFQRTFSTGYPVDRERLRATLSHAEREALAYFEDVAEGNRFDENILRSTA